MLCCADWFSPAGDAKAFKGLVLDSWLNILILATPIGWAAHFGHWNAYAIFILNLVSLIPLAMIIGKLTEDLATRYGDTIGARLLGSCVLCAALLAAPGTALLKWRSGCTPGSQLCTSCQGSALLLMLLTMCMWPCDQSSQL